MLRKALKIRSKATDRWIDLIDPSQEDDIRDDQSYAQIDDNDGVVRLYNPENKINVMSVTSYWIPQKNLFILM